MPSPDVQPERIQPLNDLSPDGGDYVLYWMQQSQRPEDNPALEYAIQRANEAGLPVLVVFGLMDDYPEANLRHYTFMIEGLQETKQILEEERGIRMVVAHGSPDEMALQFAGRAHMLVCDRGYLDHQRTWRERVTEEATCPVVRVEGDVIVPVETVSDKSEYAARTIRPRIWEHAERFFVDLEPTEPEHPSTGDAIDLSGVAFEPIDVSDVEAATDRLDLDRSVPPVSSLYRGGPRRGKDVIESFITEHMRDYDGKRNKPETSAVSYASMFLHFGQLSPVWIANRIRESGAPEPEIDSYIEELQPQQLRQPRSAARLGPDDPRRARRRRARVPLQLRGAARQPDARPILERSDDRDARDRLHAQLHAHVLGEEDPGVVAKSGGGPRPHPHAQQHVLPRRPRSQLIFERALDLRSARPRLARAPRLRQDALHEQGRLGAQGRPRRLRQEGAAPEDEGDEVTAGWRDERVEGCTDRGNGLGHVGAIPEGSYHLATKARENRFSSAKKPGR